MIQTFRILTAVVLCALGTPALATIATQLNWDAVAWSPNGALTQNYTVGPGNLNFAFTGGTADFTTFGGTLTPRLENDVTGGLSPAQQSLVLDTNYESGDADQVTLTIDFTHPGGVTGIAFSFFEVDTESGNHIDQLTVTATDGATTFNPSSMVVGSCVATSAGNTATGTCATTDTSAAGNARFTFNQTGLTRVTVVYRNTIAQSDPGNQYIALHDISFAYLSADLSLGKAVSNSTPTAGDQLVFTLTLNNGGSDTAPGIAVADLLPSGFAYVSHTGAGSYVPGTGVWTVGSVASGGSAVLNITARVEAVGSYSNTAQVSASGVSDPDSTPNNSAPAEDDQDTEAITRTPLAVIKRTFQPDGTPLASGSTLPRSTLVKFMLYVNNRAGAFIDMSLADVLDPRFAYVAGSMRFASAVTACALAACTVAEEAAIFTAADGGTVGSDAINADVVSAVAATIRAGNAVAANARLDIPANRVWALVFTAQIQ